MLISTTLIGQNASFDDCSVSPMYPTSEVPPVFISEDLKTYLSKELPEDYFKQASRSFTVQILIDKSGTPCCRSILNFKDIDTELLKDVINRMPNWTPAKNSDKEINVSTTLFLNIKKGKLKKVTLMNGANKVDKQNK